MRTFWALDFASYFAFPDQHVRRAPLDAENAIKVAEPPKFFVETC
jgi:hypothetical protein